LKSAAKLLTAEAKRQGVLTLATRQAHNQVND
jgi:hypothetical protein